MKMPLLLAAAVSLSASLSSPAASLVAAWDFRTPPGVVLDPKDAAQIVPLVMSANVGSGTLFLDGASGSSLWNGQPGDATQLRTSGGTPLNAEGLPSGKRTVALVLRQPADALNHSIDTNGGRIAFEIAASGRLLVSYAYRRSSSNAYQQVLWEISSDARTWTPFDTVSYAADTAVDWAVTTLKPAAIPAGLQKVWLRATFTGANPNPSSPRNFQITNIRILAEPL